MQERKLINSPKKYKLETMDATINIYSSNIPYPIIKYNGIFDIVDDESSFTMKQIFKKSNSKIRMKKIFGKKVAVIDGCKIIKRGRSITAISNKGVSISQINGRTFVNGIELTDDMFDGDNNYNNKEDIIGAPFVDLILPVNNDNLSLEINQINGQIDLRNLILDRLIISNTNGGVNLEDVDAVDTKIKLINGSVNALIAESIRNYSIHANTMIGSTSQNSIEPFDTNLTILEKKHRLFINTFVGDINITFNGRNR